MLPPPLERGRALLASAITALVLGLAGAYFARTLGFALRPAGALAYFVFLIAAPIVEEWIFRARLQAALHDLLLKKLSEGLASLVSIGLISLLFAAAHYPALGANAAWLMLPSLALGACWAFTQQLAACALMHAVFNACLVVLSKAVT